MAARGGATRRVTMRPRDGVEPGVAANVAVSGVAVMCATTVTNPLDVIKVRVQTSARRRAGALVGTALDVGRREGLGTFWRGISPALTRAALYGGCRLGLYDPMLRVVAPAVEREREGAPRVATRLLAGAASGAFAAAALNPTELLKTRMQTEAGASTTLMGHLRAVVREGGVGGLWRGSGLAMTRSAVLTATQVATYGEVKRRVVDLGLVDADGAKWRLHFAVAMLTGVVTTATTNPVDMLKTRLYVANAAASGGANAPTVRGTLVDVLARYGPFGLFRGFSANYMRLGPQTVVTFVVAEYLRERFGMSAL